MSESVTPADPFATLSDWLFGAVELVEDHIRDSMTLRAYKAESDKLIELSFKYDSAPGAEQDVRKHQRINADRQAELFAKWRRRRQDHQPAQNEMAERLPGVMADAIRLGVQGGEDRGTAREIVETAGELLRGLESRLHRFPVADTLESADAVADEVRRSCLRLATLQAATGGADEPADAPLVADSPDQGANAERRRRGEKTARACELKRLRPELSRAEVAECIGCDVSTLAKGRYPTVEEEVEAKVARDRAKRGGNVNM
jgi:hypothetical protein